METALERAARTVASACAINSTFVKVISVEPFKVSPDNLFLLRFKAIGLTSDAQLSTFLKTLSSLLPDQLSTDIRVIPINPDIQIGLVVNHVEALLLKLEAGGFN
jgi:hypothetical protein